MGQLCTQWGSANSSAREMVRPMFLRVIPKVEFRKSSGKRLSPSWGLSDRRYTPLTSKTVIDDNSLTEYADVFECHGCLADPYHIAEIDPTAQPAIHPPRKVLVTIREPPKIGIEENGRGEHSGPSERSNRLGIKYGYSGPAQQAQNMYRSQRSSRSHQAALLSSSYHWRSCR